MNELANIYRGKSFSIGFTIPAEYDESRIEDLKVNIGTKVYQHTIVQGVIGVNLTSNDTAKMVGRQDVVLTVEDSSFGVQKLNCGYVYVSSTISKFQSESFSDVYDVMVMLSFYDEKLEPDHVLFNYLKGKTAYEYAVEGGFAGTEEEFYIALGTISDPKDYIDFNDNPVSFVARRFGWDAANGTFSFGLSDGGAIQIGQEDFDFYTNVDTVPLTEGMPVSSVSIPGNRNAIKRTDPTIRASAEAFLGLVTVASIAVNGVGRVTLRGKVSPFNTSSFAENATLYVTGTGAIGTTEPAAGTYKIIVGTVAVSANNGTINVNKYIRPKLTELSDVDGTTTLMNNGDKLMKQESDGVVRFITYQNVKADLKNVNDALYEPILGFTPVDSADLGQPNGVATLDNDGLVPASQLPSFVDDIVDAYGTYTDVSDPTTLIELWTDATHTVAVDKYTGKIYVDVVTRFQFRWSGSVWGAILSGPVQSVAGKTGNVLLVKGDVGLSNVDNTSDVNKPISTAVSIALGGKVSTTGDETIAGVKTFQSSPIVPDGATGKQAVNYDQMDAYVTAELGLPPVEVEGSVGLEENAAGEVGIGIAPETGTKLKVAGASKFGGAVNNVTIDTNGNIRLNGGATVWDDIDFPIIIRTVGVGIPTLEPFGTGALVMPQWQVNDTNQCESKEFVHSWKEGSRVYWHLHLDTNGTNVDNRYVKFQLEFAYSAAGAWQFPAVVTTDDILIPANTPDKTQIIMPLHNFVPTGTVIGDHIMCRLTRVASTGAAPTGNPFIPMVQLHIEKDSLGSNEMTTKS